MKRYGRLLAADSVAILVVTNSISTAKPPIPPGRWIATDRECLSQTAA